MAEYRDARLASRMTLRFLTVKICDTMWASDVIKVGDDEKRGESSVGLFIGVGAVLRCFVFGGLV